MRHFHQYCYEREMRAAWQKLAEFLQQTCRDEIPELPNPEDVPVLPEAA